MFVCFKRVVRCWREAGQRGSRNRQAKEGPRSPCPVFRLHFIWFSLRVHRGGREVDFGNFPGWGKVTLAPPVRHAQSRRGPWNASLSAARSQSAGVSTFLVNPKHFSWRDWVLWIWISLCFSFICSSLSMQSLHPHILSVLYPLFDCLFPF